MSFDAPRANASPDNASPDAALHLYEELLLLALDDEKGHLTTGFTEQALAGALLAELLLEGRLTVAEDRKGTVHVANAAPIGDALLDAALERVATARKPDRLKHWVSRLAQLKDLRARAAEGLCRRGILRADHDKVLWVFDRTRYPEVDGAPEQAVAARLHAAVFDDDAEVAPRTLVLLALTKGLGLLGSRFGRWDVAARRSHVEALLRGERAGTAAREVIDACRTAVVVATLMPTFVAASAGS